MNPRVSDGARGFSLLELLLVMVIVAVLVSLIVPSFAPLRRAALRTQCLAQLRGLAQAHTAYMTDHGGRFVDAGLPHGNLTDEEVAWINTMQSYYNDDLALRSPLDASPHWSGGEDGQGLPIEGTQNIFRRTSYGLNNYLTQYSPIWSEQGWRHDRLSKVNNPAATVHWLIMAFEEPDTPFPGAGGYPGADHVHVEQWEIDPPVIAATQTQTNAVRGPAASWGSVSNYAFIDGHVGSFKFGEVYLDEQTNRFDPRRSDNWAIKTNQQ